MKIDGVKVSYTVRRCHAYQSVQVTMELSGNVAPEEKTPEAAAMFKGLIDRMAPLVDAYADDAIRDICRQADLG